MGNVKTRVYKAELINTTGLQTLISIDDLTTLGSDDTIIMLDIETWSIFYTGPENITEWSQLIRRQLTIKKVGGGIDLVNDQVIYSREHTTGSNALTFTYSVAGPNLLVETDVTGVNQSIFFIGTATIQTL